MLTFPVRLGLELPVPIGRPRVAVINKGHAVPNENAIFQSDAFTDEGMAGNLATGADFSPFLNFNECSDFGLVADLTSVEVNEPANANVPAQFDVRSDQSMPRNFAPHRRRTLKRRETGLV